LTLQNVDEVLVFTLNGLSKTVGLPQMKLAWAIVHGPPDQVDEALSRLEMIADTYLSAGTPVQCALPSLLELREPVQRQIIGRLHTNLSLIQPLNLEAGWYAILRAEEGAGMHLLRDHNVLVQPGYFYDFDSQGYIVVSLLTPPEIFREGLRRMSLG
jgi:aspartate/methionine/tyrosine aminotransferase